MFFSTSKKEVSSVNCFYPMDGIRIGYRRRKMYVGKSILPFAPLRYLLFTKLSHFNAFVQCVQSEPRFFYILNKGAAFTIKIRPQTTKKREKQAKNVLKFNICRILKLLDKNHNIQKNKKRDRDFLIILSLFLSL